MQQLFQQKTGIETAALQRDAVLFNAETNRFCVLNSTSSFIWEKLQAPASVDALTQEVVTSFAGVSVDQARQDVVATIDKLVSFDLAACVG
jgi:hypothetical protein